MSLTKIREVIDELGAILHDSVRREERILSFTRDVFKGNRRVEDEQMAAYLVELASELDLYEPNPEYRKEDAQYYGDERLKQIIKDALVVLKKAAE